MKVAICVPHYGDVKARFAQSLGRMIASSLTAPVDGPKGPVRLEIELFFSSSSVLPQARHEVVAAGLKWGAEWLLLLDTDQTFPPDALLRLLAHGAAAVGCNYEKRDGSGPVVERASGLMEVDHIGLGVFLVHRHPFEVMSSNGGVFPLFMLTLADEGSGYVGEDVFFCRKLKAAGFPVLCDHDLSAQIGHISEVVREASNAGAILPTAGDQPRR
jgi:hypothetical protein